MSGGWIIKKYARLDSKGRPCFCRPSQAEVAAKLPHKQDVGVGKVIYPDHAAARAAAVELGELQGHRLVEYPCQRSRKGHFHLTTDRGATP